MNQTFNDIRLELIRLIENELPESDLKNIKKIVEHAISESKNGTPNASKAEEYLRFIELLEQNHKRFYCIKEYAELMNVSPRRLNKLVNDYSGKSTCTHVSDRIIKAGKELLSTTTLSVKEIAFAMGFSDQYYFSRFFKKYVGLAPSQFRKQEYPSN